ncbi:CsbD family protein [Floridanema evergladense]|uniref:CsbD family protein n=1 Tax=Floridaenema evergladense BLCC-F167 TaxID=3153639 RepID=A0ABV4WM19_9CYAN
MSIEDKIKAAAKDAEGKLQAAAGELTGDRKMKTEGEIKQAQAAALNTAADVKDKAQNLLDGIKNAASDAIDKVKQKLD